MIRNDALEGIVNEQFYGALQAWYYTELYGLANGDLGWANENINYIDAITAITMEKNAMENEEHEASMAKGRAKGSKDWNSFIKDKE